jgi:hypothetical protein
MVIHVMTTKRNKRLGEIPADGIGQQSIASYLEKDIPNVSCMEDVSGMSLFLYDSRDDSVKPYPDALMVIQVNTMRNGNVQTWITIRSTRCETVMCS